MIGGEGVNTLVTIFGGICGNDTEKYGLDARGGRRHGAGPVHIPGGGGHVRARGREMDVFVSSFAGAHVVWGRRCRRKSSAPVTALDTRYGAAATTKPNLTTSHRLETHTKDV